MHISRTAAQARNTVRMDQSLLAWVVLRLEAQLCGMLVNICGKGRGFAQNPRKHTTLKQRSLV